MRYFYIFLVLIFAQPALAQDEWHNVDRVVAVGDLHGDYGQYIRILKLNGLVDKRLKWTGGHTHLVQMGDVPDRGPNSLKIIRHLMKLEREARRAGGYVHALIGNHEAMNIEGDLRYTSPGDFSVLVTRRSQRLQQDYLDRVFEYMLKSHPELADTKDQTMAELAQKFPLGYVEHRRLWEPHQEIAKWVARHNAVIKIDRSLFVHGGIDPHNELMPISRINDEIRKTLSSNLPFPPGNLADAEDGPLWYRGLARHTAEVEQQPLEEMLKYYDVDRIVIAHTRTQGNIVSRFDGLVIMVDVGISAVYGSHTANLVIEAQSLSAMTPDGKVPIEVQ